MNRTIDRDLLRRTGEHLGMLAEQAKEAHDLAHVSSPSASVAKRIKIQSWDRYAKLSRLSREILELVKP